MYKFNNSNLITGFIKEFLQDFYIPTCDIWKEGEEQEGKLYIKNNYFQRYLGNGQWDRVGNYKYGRAYLNTTTNLKIANTQYDLETHYQLGNYLRFIRDYWDLDLMGLYNCFGKEKVTNLVLTLDKDRFSTNDSNYVYYSVPVRLNKDYTIALSSNKPIEFACILYDNVLINDNVKNHETGEQIEDLYVSEEMANKSFKKVNSPSFFQPFLFSTKGLLTKDLEYSCKSRDKKLKLIIKVPQDFKSSVVILEGDFRNCTSTQIGKFKESHTYEDEYGNLLIDSNQNTLRFINNYNLTFEGNTVKQNSMRLSLLQVNDNTSYPFADKLVEFLVGNVICQTDTCEENVKRVQNAIYNSLLGYKGLWNDGIRNKIMATLYRASTEDAKLKKLMNNTLDLTFYVDKDIETALELKGAFGIRYTED